MFRVLYVHHVPLLLRTTNTHRTREYVATKTHLTRDYVARKKQRNVMHI
jgi:hypothetical protein